MNQYHDISDSEIEEGSSKFNKFSLPESFKSKYKKSKHLKKAVFKNGVQDNTVLFSEDITDDDEIWLLQCPLEVNDNSFVGKIIVTEDDDVTDRNIKLKCGKRRKKYDVFTIDSKNHHISCILPTKQTKTFDLNVVPVSGRIVLQENINFGKLLPKFSTPEDCNTTFDDTNNISVKSEPFDVSIRSEYSDSFTVCNIKCNEDTEEIVRSPAKKRRKQK